MQGLWDQDKETELKATLHKEITSAAAVAESILLPSVDSLFEDVYAEIPIHLQKQVRTADLARAPRPGPRCVETGKQGSTNTASCSCSVLSRSCAFLFAVRVSCKQQKEMREHMAKYRDVYSEEGRMT